MKKIAPDQRMFSSLVLVVFVVVLAVFVVLVVLAVFVVLVVLVVLVRVVVVFVFVVLTDDHVIIALRLVFVAAVVCRFGGALLPFYQRMVGLIPNKLV